MDDSFLMGIMGCFNISLYQSNLGSKFCIYIFFTHRFFRDNLVGETVKILKVNIYIISLLIMLFGTSYQLCARFKSLVACACILIWMMIALHYCKNDVIMLHEVLKCSLPLDFRSVVWCLQFVCFIDSAIDCPMGLRFSEVMKRTALIWFFIDSAIDSLRFNFFFLF